MFRRLLAIACALIVLTPLAARAADAKYVKLVQADTGKVLSIENDSEEAGARAVVAAAGKSESQQWTLEKDGDHLKLVNRKSGKVLDVFEDSQDEGTPIIVWDDKSEGTDNQRWAWVGEGKERRLKSKSSGHVLDIDSEGKLVQRKADEKAKTQLWRVEEVK